MKKKGFTLVELLIVIAIIALLMGILMPALARVRMYAYRMICGTNLAGIGKAIQLYAGDASEAYPFPGCTASAVLSNNCYLVYWHDPLGWGAKSDDTCSNSVYSGNQVTMGSLYYLLVKYEDVSVKQFNCKGDAGARVFKLSDYNPTVTDFPKAWDFGQKPGIFNSYSYNSPFRNPTITNSQRYLITSNSAPSEPLAADRNPALDENVNYLIRPSVAIGGAVPAPDAAKGIQTPQQRWGAANTGSYKDTDLVYNSAAHQREGQNVLFNDGHVKFESTANVGTENDNIWQQWSVDISPDAYNRQVNGYFPRQGTSGNPGSLSGDNRATFSPKNNGDAVLVSEHQGCGRPPLGG